MARDREKSQSSRESAATELHLAVIPPQRSLYDGADPRTAGDIALQRILVEEASPVAAGFDSAVRPLSALDQPTTV
jgi:hypothetical protein